MPIANNNNRILGDCYSGNADNKRDQYYLSIFFKNLFIIHSSSSQKMIYRDKRISMHGISP
jgi:hypothetical protein